MVINEQVRDLDINPNVQKQITLDLQKIIPTDNRGDEVYVISAVTTAVSKLTSTANISPIFLRDFKAGYSKSTGFKSPPFNITTSNNKLQIAVDGSSYREVTLETGNGLTGEDIATDLQTKISALGGSGATEEGNLGFLNILVQFINGRFRVISGTISNTYTGTAKSSVSIIAATSSDASSTLGFDIPVESESLSSKQAAESKLIASYSSGVTLHLDDVAEFTAGSAFTVSDGSNREYFVAASVSSASGTMTISGAGLNNSYATGSIVQHIFERDPDSSLASPYEDIDAMVRFQVRSLANQIDFSS